MRANEEYIYIYIYIYIGCIGKINVCYIDVYIDFICMLHTFCDFPKYWSTVSQSLRRVKKNSKYTPRELFPVLSLFLQLRTIEYMYIGGLSMCFLDFLHVIDFQICLCMFTIEQVFGKLYFQLRFKQNPLPKLPQELCDHLMCL